MKILHYLSVPLSIVASPLVASGAEAAERPNILFITIDDMNDWIGVMGTNPDVQTPHLDQFASTATLFTEAHCQFPLCGPSRASIMSGMHPDTLRIWSGDAGIEKTNQRTEELGGRTLDKHFQDQGYKTIFRAKVYHGTVNSSFGNAHFDVFGGNGSWGPKPPEKLNYDHNGTQTDWGAYPATDEEMSDYQTATWVADQLTQTHDKPFFMGVGIMRPHVPFYVPQKWFDLYDRETLTMPPYKSDDWEDLPAGADSNATFWSPHIELFPDEDPDSDNLIGFDGWRDAVHAYLACISFLDAQIGRILDALEASPYADNTIVVILSDHGYHVGEKNLIQKHSLWERSTHVPLLVKLPGQMTGQVSSRPVGLIDLYPTLTELADLPEPPRYEGRSLVPLLEEPDLEWSHPVLTNNGTGNHAASTEDWRYIRYGDDSGPGEGELYDMNQDRNEWHNVVTNPQYEPVREELSSSMTNSYFLRVDITVEGDGEVVRETELPDHAYEDGEPRYHMGQIVDLRAVPEFGNVFIGWSGHASGASPETSVVVSPWNRSVTATFAPGTASYSNWEHYGPDLADKTADNDSDSFSNFAEYLLRMDPRQPDSPSDGGAPSIEMPQTHYTFRIKSDDPSTAFRVEVSEDLQSWHHNGDGSGHTWTETVEARWHAEDHSTTYKVAPSGPLVGDRVFFRLDFEDQL